MSCTVPGCLADVAFSEQINGHRYEWCQEHLATIRPTAVATGKKATRGRKRATKGRKHQRPLKPRSWVETQCVWCGRNLDTYTVTMDHVIPKSRGGQDRKNMAPACNPCNQEKGDRTASEYLETLREKGRR